MSITMSDDMKRALLAEAIKSLTQSVARGPWDRVPEKTPIQRVFDDAVAIVIREEVERFLTGSPALRDAIRGHVATAVEQVMRGNEFLRDQLCASLAQSLSDVTKQEWRD
jgi:hypothetical protein